MAGPAWTSVDEYLATQPETGRGLLEQVRAAIRRALPDAEETISYNIPTYKIKGRAVVYFAGWSRHYAVYPAGEAITAELKGELAPYKVTKGTIRFPLTEPVPSNLIERIARLRAREAAKP